ncbi:MAG: hypothetical protein DLM52_09480, partial [Chthoniobacterales bacterium]
SGPVETKEEVDKLPPEVRQRYDKLQQHDLPSVSPDELRAGRDGDDDEDENDADEDTAQASGASYEQAAHAPLPRGSIIFEI